MQFSNKTVNELVSNIIFAVEKIQLNCKNKPYNKNKLK